MYPFLSLMRFVCPVHYLYRTLAAAQKTPYGVMSSNPIDNRRQQWWFGLLSPVCIRLLSALVIGHVGHVGIGWWFSPFWPVIPLVIAVSSNCVPVTISPDDVVRLSDGFQYEMST